MGKSRAARRHHTEKKKARTRKILKRYGTSDWLTDRRVGRFTESHWGCQCDICRNPRRRNKGKNRDSLTVAEFREEHDNGKEE